MSSITILTPTYNRADCLSELYCSLTEQTSRDFEWYVVDDGSTDGTMELIQGYLEEKKIPIRYERKANGGKHTALNQGIANIQSELTFIVDSDDYLPQDAVETILFYHGKYRNTDNLCGYSFLRCHRDGTVNTAYFPGDELVGTYRQVRICGNIGGDKAEVFYTDILRKYPFPVFQGEKFLPEDIVWMRMSGPYQMVHINKNIYYCDYRKGGLTRGGHRMKIHSPQGMILRSKIYLEEKDIPFRIKIKMMLLYLVYGRFAGYTRKRLWSETSRKALYSVCYLPGLAIYLKWQKEEKSGS